MNQTKKIMSGVHTALVTPFKNQKIDEPSWNSLLERQKKAGIHGVIIAGTTGESPTLSSEEWGQLVTLAARHRDTLQISAGVGGNNTAEVIEKCKKAAALGAHTALAVTPYYNKPPQWALLKHYEAVANASPIPIILYNVPGRTAVDLLPTSTLVLAGHPNICAVKEASGQVTRFMELKEKLSQVRPDFGLLSGDDPLFYPSLVSGASGIISVMTNVWPDLFCGIYKNHINKNNLESESMSVRLAPLMEVLYSVTNPIGIKWFGAQKGYWLDECRLPLVSLTHAPEGIRSSFSQAAQKWVREFA